MKRDSWFNPLNSQDLMSCMPSHYVYHILHSSCIKNVDLFKDKLDIRMLQHQETYLQMCKVSTKRVIKWH